MGKAGPRDHRTCHHGEGLLQGTKQLSQTLCRRWRLEGLWKLVGSEQVAEGVMDVRGAAGHAPAAQPGGWLEPREVMLSGGEGGEDAGVGGVRMLEWGEVRMLSGGS